MFDGAAVATAAQAAEAAPNDSSAHSTPTTDNSDYGQAAAAATPSQDTSGTRNVLFIDARVKDASGLVADLKPDTAVFALVRNQDEFKEQLWQYLNRRVSDWRIITGKERAKDHAGRVSGCAGNPPASCRSSA